VTLPSDRATRAGIARSSVVRFKDEQSEVVEDAVVVEEPLQIRIAGEPWVTTLRTPGSDNELVLGFLLAEGVIQSAKDVLSIAPCGRPGDENAANVIEVCLAPGVASPLEHEERRRATLSNASCGVCGRASVDDLLARVQPISSETRFEPAWIAGLEMALGAAQRNFAVTGGLHAAGVAASGANLRVVREDVGRHNAVDKAIGRLLIDGALPASDSALVVSGRAGFEIVQKALAAGIPALICVSAPTSLAIQTAERSGALLVGFARGASFNVYAGGGRLVPRREHVI
jgi:FdhD protein